MWFTVRLDDAWRMLVWSVACVILLFVFYIVGHLLAELWWAVRVYWFGMPNDRIAQDDQESSGRHAENDQSESDCSEKFIWRE